MKHMQFGSTQNSKIKIMKTYNFRKILVNTCKGNHFSKVSGLQAVTVLKNELSHRCFLRVFLTFKQHLF